MNTQKLLPDFKIHILNRSNLTKSQKNCTIEDLNVYDTTLSTEEINKADLIVFIDHQEFKTLKQKYSEMDTWSINGIYINI